MSARASFGKSVSEGLINVIRAPAENFPDADWEVVSLNVFHSFQIFPDHNIRFFKST